MTEDEARQFAERLREVLARRGTLQEAAQATGKSVAACFRLARRLDLPRRRRASLSTAQRQEIRRLLRSDRTIREIAARTLVGIATVFRHKQCALGPGPKQVAKYFCHGCRTSVNLRPCQICAARQAAETARKSGTTPPSSPE